MTFLANETDRVLGSMHSCTPHLSRPMTINLLIFPLAVVGPPLAGGLGPSGFLCSAVLSAMLLLVDEHWL
jgi:hypothetical protein